MPEFILQTLQSAARLALAGAIVILAFVVYGFFRRPAPPPLLAMDGRVGPPLVTVSLGAAHNVKQVHIGCDGPYEVTSWPRAASVSVGDVLAGIPISSQGTDLFFGSANLQSSEIRLTPTRGGSVSVDGRRYAGILRVVRSGELVSAYNELDLESYLEGVLGAEMMLNWNDAALEAQAIIARTYALYSINQAQRATGKSNPALPDDVQAQVYQGLSVRTPRAIEIVRRTRGMVLIHGGALIRTLFHSTCGGGTEPGYLYFDVPDIAPLMGRPCPYCAKSPHLKWRASYTKKEMGALLAAWNPGEKPIAQLAVVHTAPGGRITQLSFSTAGGVQGRTLPANEFRLALGPGRLRSTWFTFVDKGAAIEFEGRGWGHGVGLCQYGAKEMGDGRIGSLDILRFYYPDADVVRIY